MMVTHEDFGAARDADSGVTLPLIQLIDWGLHQREYSQPMKNPARGPGP